MDKRCRNCARQYFCEDFKKKKDCEKFISWFDTRNNGIVKRIEGGKNVHNKKRKFR